MSYVQSLRLFLAFNWHLIGKQDDFFQVFPYLLVLPLLLAKLNIFKWFVPLFLIKRMLYIIKRLRNI